MQRRSLLRLGLFGTVVLASLGGGIAWRNGPGWHDGRASPAARPVIRAAADALLIGLLPTTGAPRAQTLDQVVMRIDASITGLPRHAQRELSQALALLAHPAGRWAIAGLAADWQSASREDVSAGLERMRQSRTELPRQLYQALRDLTMAAWIADPDAWPEIGYPGPRALVQEPDAR